VIIDTLVTAGTVPADAENGRVATGGVRDWLVPIWPERALEKRWTRLTPGEPGWVGPRQERAAAAIPGPFAAQSVDVEALTPEIEPNGGNR